MADLNGDGKTDVFAALPQADGAYQWGYYSAGLPPFVNLARTPHPLADLNFGDFNGDGKSDVFAVTSLPNGRAAWAYYPGGLAPAVALQTGPAALPFLGDFNGDSKADAFLANCTAQPGAGPGFTRLPKQPLPAFLAAGNYRPFLAHLNGDGRQDWLWSSICQDQACKQANNRLASAISDGRGGFIYSSEKVLDTSRSWLSANRFTGDLNGDGRDDMLFFYPRIRFWECQQHL